MKTFRSKLILMFLFYGFLISTISVGIIYKFNLSNLKTATIEKSLFKLDSINDYFNYEINSIVLQLNSIKESYIFQDYLQNKEKNNLVSELFITLAKTSKSVMQLRYIDITGQEKIRVDRSNYLQEAHLLPKESLQDKSQRYYFKQSIKLNNNDIWFSNLDLNIEQGKIEKPIKPVLRIATPVFHKGKKEGIIIINIFMQDTLDKMTHHTLFNIYIIDKEGNFLIHPNSLHNWGKYLNKSFTIKEKYEEFYSEILNNSFYKNRHIVSKNLAFNNKEEIKVIIEPKLYFIQSQLAEHAQELLLTLFIVVLFSFPLAYMFSRHPTRLKEKVDKFNETLENKIKSRTRRLHIANAKFKRIATMDFLTNIPNRRYFFTMGNKLFASVKREKLSLSMVVLDIDFFKKINDTYGHKIGDKVLVQIAKTIESEIREEDIVARVGGEEFAIILNNTSLIQGMKISEKIREKIESTPYIKEGIIIHLSTSIGVAQYILEDNDLESLYDRADKALYVAKNSGRNCVKYL